MFNVTIDSMRECKTSSQDLIYDLASEFADLVSAVRIARGDAVAEAFLQLIRNMDDASAFSVAKEG